MSDRDKQDVVAVVQDLIDLGFKVVATTGTRQVLKEHGVAVELVVETA